MKAAAVSFRVVLAGCVLAAASAAAAQVRDLVLDVTVRTADGRAMAGVGVGGETGGGRWLAVTDEAGRAAATIQLAEDEEAVFASLRPSVDLDQTSAAEGRAAFDAMMALAHDFAFASWYEVPFPPGQGAGQLVIEVVPAIHARGRVVDAAGAPLRATILVRGAPAFYESDPLTGEFVVGGLRPGVPGEFFVITENGVYPVRVPASADGIEVGDVIATEVAGEGTINITVANMASTPMRHVTRVSGITLVPLGGGPVLTFLADTEGRIVLDYSGPAGPSVPAGRYAVVPGAFMATPEQLAVLDAVRAQRDLRAMGVSTITVVAGREVAMEVDEAGVEAAIRQAVAGGQ